MKAPILGPSRIIEQAGAVGGGYFYFRIQPDRPPYFPKYADAKNISDNPMSFDDWRQQHSARGSGEIPVMNVDLREKLERGEKVSPREREFFHLNDTGCLEEKNRVICSTIELRHLEIFEPRKGMLVEFEDSESSQVGWPGRIADVEEDGTVLLEVFNPIPFMETPLTLDESKMRPGFWSELTPAFGATTLKAWERSGRPRPAGKWMRPAWEDKDALYYLDEPIPLTEIEAMCKDELEDKEEQRFCSLQSTWLFVLPLDLAGTGENRRGGVFRPLPEDLDPYEVVATAWDE